MTKLKCGVIGTGTIAQEHLRSYVSNPDVELVAVCDINPQRAQQAASRFGARRAYSNTTEMLGDLDLDAVSVCTWNDTHVPLAIAAIEAGKHVLVEKPIGRTYAEALELQRVSDRHGLVTQAGFSRRHSPNCQVLKSFVDAGDLGDVYFAKASCVRRNGNPGGWFADKSVAGGGPVLDLGVHMIDLAWYLMGLPKATAVSANVYSKLGNRAHITSMPRYQVSDYDPNANSVEDMANALVRFENGASLLFETSFSLHAVADYIGVSVHGDRGGAELEPNLEIATERHNTVINIAPQISSRTLEFELSFEREVANFVDTILGRAEGITPIWQGVEVMRILEGIYTSAAAGAEVVLPAPEPRVLGG